MTPFGELPQWMDIGPDTDFASPLTSLAAQLKKRLTKNRMEGGLKDAGKADVLPMSDQGAGKVESL